MDLDTITLYLKSVTDKMTNNLKNAIHSWQQYDNATNKVANSMKNVTNATNNINSNFSASKMKAEDLKKEIESLTSEYERQAKAFSQRSAGMSSVFYNPTQDLGLGMTGDPTAGMVITQEKLDRQKELLDELQEYLKNITESQKSEEGSPAIDNLEKGLKESSSEANGLIQRLREILRLQNKTGTSGGSGGGGSQKPDKSTKEWANNFKGMFKTRGVENFTKSLSNGIDSSLRKIKKLALGLIGVRTAMSVLTKAVNSYLSFDSELQESLTNSWNMLGSLLAPAIEFVARLFAMATNYVAQFVSALTGIDLVARANAKALDTQAKSSKAAANAQRGLLGMDEITNLPTESASSPASQIKIDDSVKSFKLLDDILAHLKEGKWHEVGEDIADAINGLLGDIQWDSIQKNFQALGYNIADFLNGVFELNWTQLGTTLGNGINTAINFAYGFVEKFSFIRFGAGLGRAVSGAFTSIDWEMLATTISDGVVGIFNGIKLFLVSVDWEGIGESIKTFLVNIQWAEIADAVLEAMRSAFKGIDTLLESIFGESTASIIEGIALAIGAVTLAIGLMNAGLALSALLSSPLTLIVLTIGLVIGAIILLGKNMKTVGNALKAFFTTLGKAIYTVFAGIVNLLIDAINIILFPLRGLIVALGKVSGKNWSLSTVKIPKIPMLETGTPYIESEGLYHLHEGEMVTPKRYNPNANGYDNGNDNKQIIDLLVSLNASMLSYAERPIEVNMDGKRVAEGIYNDMREIDKNKNKSSVMVRS